MKNYYAEAISRIDEMGSLEAEKIWEVLVEIAKAHPSVFVKAYDMVCNPKIDQVFVCQGAKDCKKFVGEKIKAIKACREATGKGLRDAKDAVEGECPLWK